MLTIVVTITCSACLSLISRSNPLVSIFLKFYKHYFLVLRQLPYEFHEIKVNISKVGLFGIKMILYQTRLAIAFQYQGLKQTLILTSLKDL